MRLCIGLCLLLAGNVIPSSDDEILISDVWYDIIYKHSDEQIARERERCKNSEVLKDDLASAFTMDVYIWDEEIPLYKEKFGIADDTLRTALMGIYEKVQHVGKDPFSSDDPEEVTDDKRRLHYALEWLGYCADKSTKEFLKKVATDKTIDRVFRNQAIRAYLRNATAKEFDWVTSLLADKSQNTSSIYSMSIEEYARADSDTKRRKAIASVLSAALAKEEDKYIFNYLDKDFAKLDKDYANSPQRRAALQRLDLPLPPDPPKEEKKPWWKIR